MEIDSGHVATALIISHMLMDNFFMVSGMSRIDDIGPIRTDIDPIRSGPLIPKFEEFGHSLTAESSPEQLLPQPPYGGASHRPRSYSNGSSQGSSSFSYGDRETSPGRSGGPSVVRKRVGGPLGPSGVNKTKTTHCSVCGDVAPEHVHYGSVTCFSCRAFFRR